MTFEVDQSPSGDDAEPSPGPGDRSPRMQPLVDVIAGRLEAAGVTGASVQVDGFKVVVRVPGQHRSKVDFIQRLVGATGHLEFRIVATDHAHDQLVEAARRQADDAQQRRQSVVRDATGKTLGFWAEVARDREVRRDGTTLKFSAHRDILRDHETGTMLVFESPDLLKFDEDPRRFEAFLAQRGVATIDVLMADEARLRVNGNDLSRVEVSEDDGTPTVRFWVSSADARRRLTMLTSSHVPLGQQTFRLGILLDGRLLTAPTIQGTISDRGQITGRLTREECEELAAILQAGVLPVRLKPPQVEILDD